MQVEGGYEGVLTRSRILCEKLGGDVDDVVVVVLNWSRVLG